MQHSHPLAPSRQYEDFKDEAKVRAFLWNARQIMRDHNPSLPPVGASAIADPFATPEASQSSRAHTVHIPRENYRFLSHRITLDDLPTIPETREGSVATPSPVPSQREVAPTEDPPRPTSPHHPPKLFFWHDALKIFYTHIMEDLGDLDDIKALLFGTEGQTPIEVMEGILANGPPDGIFHSLWSSYQTPPMTSGAFDPAYPVSSCMTGTNSSSSFSYTTSDNNSYIGVEPIIAHSDDDDQSSADSGDVPSDLLMAPDNYGYRIGAGKSLSRISEEGSVCVTEERRSEAASSSDENVDLSAGTGASANDDSESNDLNLHKGGEVSSSSPQGASESPRRPVLSIVPSPHSSGNPSPVSHVDHVVAESVIPASKNPPPADATEFQWSPILSLEPSLHPSLNASPIANQNESPETAESARPRSPLLRLLPTFIPLPRSPTAYQQKDHPTLESLPSPEPITASHALIDESWPLATSGRDGINDELVNLEGSMRRRMLYKMDEASHASPSTYEFAKGTWILRRKVGREEIVRDMNARILVPSGYDPLKVDDSEAR